MGRLGGGGNHARNIIMANRRADSACITIILMWYIRNTLALGAEGLAGGLAGGWVGGWVLWHAKLGVFVFGCSRIGCWSSLGGG